MPSVIRAYISSERCLIWRSAPRACDLAAAGTSDDNGELTRKILLSEPYSQSICSAVEFESSINTLKLIKPFKKRKKKRLRRYVGGNVLFRGRLSESAKKLWESNGA